MLDIDTIPESPPTRFRRNEHLSPWSLVLLALVIAWQILPQLGLLSSVSSRFGLSSVTTNTHRRVDIKDVLQIDVQAKTAYASDWAAHLGIRRPELFRKLLENALEDAEEQFRNYPSDLAIARRLMILRAELGVQPLMAVSADRHRREVAPPLSAFDSASKAEAREASMWRTLFTHRMLPAGTNRKELERTIEAQSSLGWYRLLALHQFYLRSGDLQQSSATVDVACRDAIASIAPLTALYGIVLLLGLIGVMLLTGLGVRAFMLRDLPDAPKISVFDTLAVPLPDPVPPSERRLGAGDLFHLFIVCMVLFVAISQTIESLSTQVLFPHIFASIVPNGKVNAVVAIVSASQLLTTIVAFGILLWQARLRGPGIFSEIGLSFGGAAKNIAVGWAGWGIALPLVYLGASMASTLFPNTPDPSNPAIALTIRSSGLLAHAALFVTICILAPIFEETMFRGLFYQAARAKLGVWPAIVLTGVVFGLVHPVSIVGSIPLMLLGCVLAWLAETRKSLLPGMVAHSLQNVLSFLSMLFMS